MKPVSLRDYLMELRTYAESASGRLRDGGGVELSKLKRAFEEHLPKRGIR
jgi:hypothetical protein